MLMSRNKTGGFTMVEILTVLAIIIILVSILFPTFKAAQEKGNQASCLTNLHHIAIAVKQYKIDRGVYPNGIADLGDYLNLNITSGKAMGSKSVLKCRDDENSQDFAFSSSSLPYSSYFDVNTANGVQFVWNYYGYQSNGFAYSPSTSIYNTYVTMGTGTLPANVPSWRQFPCLENRFAPDYTIITHCINHRTKTGSNVNQQVDTVVRLSGDAKTVFYNTNDWVAQPE